MRGGGVSRGSADVEEIETFPPRQEGDRGERSRMSDGQEAKQEKTRHEREQPVDLTGGCGAGDVTNSTGNEISSHRNKAQLALGEMRNGEKMRQGEGKAMGFEVAFTDLILDARENGRQGLPPVVFDQFSLTVAPPGKENRWKTGNGESGGRRDGRRVAAIIALRIMNGSDQSRLSHTPLKVSLRLPTSGQVQASAGGLRGHSHQVGPEQDG